MLIYSTSAYYSLSAKIRTKWIIGHTKWMLEYFSYLALVEYRSKWIRIKRGPGVLSFWKKNRLYYMIVLIRFWIGKSVNKLDICEPLRSSKKYDDQIYATLISAILEYIFAQGTRNDKTHDH